VADNGRTWLREKGQQLFFVAAERLVVHFTVSL
jgi:hypothetical protein